MNSILDTQSKKTSPAIIRTIYKVILTDAFSSLCDTDKESYVSGQVHAILYSCISKIPIEVLHEYNMFAFGKAHGIDIGRAQLIAYLYSVGVLRPQDPYLLRATLWVAKQEQSNRNPCYWKASCQLANAAASMPPKMRSDLINALLEIIQINGVGTSSLYALLLHATILNMVRRCFSQFSNHCFLRRNRHFQLAFGTSEIMELQLHNQQISKLSLKMGVSDNVMKRSLSLAEATQQDTSARDQFECFTKVFSSSKNAGSPSLQHALVCNLD